MDIITLGIGPGSSIAANLFVGLNSGEVVVEPPDPPGVVGPDFVHNERNLLRRWRELSSEFATAISERYS